jgi:hypothetical protein
VPHRRRRNRRRRRRRRRRRCLRMKPRHAMTHEK